MLHQFSESDAKIKYFKVEEIENSEKIDFLIQSESSENITLLYNILNTFEGNFSEKKSLKSSKILMLFWFVDFEASISKSNAYFQPIKI